MEERTAQIDRSVLLARDAVALDVTSGRSWYVLLCALVRVPSCHGMYSCVPLYVCPPVMVRAPVCSCTCALLSWYVLLCALVRVPSCHGMYSCVPLSVPSSLGYVLLCALPRGRASSSLGYMLLSAHPHVLCLATLLCNAWFHTHTHTLTHVRKHAHTRAPQVRAWQRIPSSLLQQDGVCAARGQGLESVPTGRT